MNLLKKYTAIIFLILPLISFADGWEKTTSGLEYNFHVQHQGAKPMVDDFVIVDMLYGTADTVFFDSKTYPNGFSFSLKEPIFSGDMNDAIMLMCKGDSASFRISADSFYLVAMRAPKLPPSIVAGSKLIFEIKLQDFMTREEKEKSDIQIMEKNKKEEEGLMKQYLAKNNIDIKPNISGLYYIATQRGPGKMAKAGDTVNVHYKGSLLDGSVFDSSYDRGEPFRFTLGAGQVIQAWDEGIALMREGGKATLIIPSKLGYGSRAAGPIPPYSTLIFEVELIEIE